MEPYKDEYYYEASETQIRELWLSLVDKPISLYINNPFCASICRYCAYKGTPYSKEEYEQFYYTILPKRIRLFNDVIDRNYPKVLFMGGGTPSLVKPADLDNMLTSIRKLDEFELKVFEVHPALHKPEHLDVLQKHGFDVIMVGVQTFDLPALVEQNRAPYTLTEVESIIKDSNSRGFTTATDIIAFLDPSRYDHRQLNKDLDSIYKCEPHWVTIYNNYYNKSTQSVEAFVSTLGKIIASLPGFEFEHPLSREEAVMYMKTHRCIRTVSAAGKVKTRSQMALVDEMLHDTTHHQHYGTQEYYLMGVGNWRYTIYNNTFSVHFSPQRQVEYIEVSNGDEPRYFVTYDTQAKISRDEFLKHLLELLPPPDGKAKLRVDTRILPVPGKIYRKSNVCFLTFSNADQYKKMIDVKALEELSEKHDIRIELRFE